MTAFSPVGWLAKGDTDYSLDHARYVCAAEVIDRSILAYRVSIRALDESHIQAAATYALWRYAFNRPFYAERHKTNLVEIAGGSQNASHDETAYCKLLRRVK